MYKSNTWTQAWLFKHKTTNQPYSLTGVAARLHLRDEGDRLILAVEENKGITINPEMGRNENIINPYNVSTQEFLIGGEIELSLEGRSIAVGSNVTNKYSEYPTTTHITQYNLNETSITPLKYLYLVGTEGPNGGFKLDSTNFYAQSLPTTEDNKLYLFLGYVAVNGVNVSLVPYHPVYHYRDGKVKQFISTSLKSISSFELKTLNFTAVAGGQYILATGITRTLSNSPAIGDSVTFKAQANGTWPTINRNGQKIMDVADDITINGTGTITLTFAGDARGGWI